MKEIQSANSERCDGLPSAEEWARDIEIELFTLNCAISEDPAMVITTFNSIAQNLKESPEVQRTQKDIERLSGYEEDKPKKEALDYAKDKLRDALLLHMMKQLLEELSDEKRLRLLSQ